MSKSSVIAKFEINGKEIPLLSRKQLLYRIPIKCTVISSLAKTGKIPRSIFVLEMPLNLTSLHPDKNMPDNYEAQLYTEEHAVLLVSWLAWVTNDFMLRCKPSVRQVNALWEQWEKIDKFYIEKYGLPIQSGVYKAKATYFDKIVKSDYWAKSDKLKADQERIFKEFFDNYIEEQIKEKED